MQKKLKKCLTRIYKAMPEVFQYIKGTGDALALYKYIRPFWYNNLINKEKQKFFNKYKRLPNDIEKIGLIKDINNYLDEKLIIINGGFCLNKGNFGGFITSDLEGIYIFTKLEEEADKKYKNVKGNSPPKCNNIMGTINHELGHAIDKLLGISKKDKIRVLFTNNILLTSNSEEYLSDYSFDNREIGSINKKLKNNKKISDIDINRVISEFVAEAISEYLTSSTPRKISKRVWQIVQDEYKKQLGKELRL